jgi:hypothetical protein
MDPVKKEVHSLKGPVHLLAEDHARIMGVPCPCCRDKEKGEEIEIKTA